MQIKVKDSKRDGTTRMIRARAGDRDVEVELEASRPTPRAMR
jgi:hypothetical protein